MSPKIRSKVMAKGVGDTSRIDVIIEYQPLR
jgi:hypothetical protein